MEAVIEVDGQRPVGAASVVNRAVVLRRDPLQHISDVGRAVHVVPAGGHIDVRVVRVIGLPDAEQDRVGFGGDLVAIGGFGRHCVPLFWWSGKPEINDPPATGAACQFPWDISQIPGTNGVDEYITSWSSMAVAAMIVAFPRGRYSGWLPP